MSICGRLARRFEKEQPVRRLLALDGGGIRGVLALEILAEIERSLAKHVGAGPEFGLGDYYALDDLAEVGRRYARQHVQLEAFGEVLTA